MIQRPEREAQSQDDQEKHDEEQDEERNSRNIEKEVLDLQSFSVTRKEA